jgi:hypothetical protein
MKNMYNRIKKEVGEMDNKEYINLLNKMVKRVNNQIKSAEMNLQELKAHKTRIIAEIAEINGLEPKEEINQNS